MHAPHSHAETPALCCLLTMAIAHPCLARAGVSFDFRVIRTQELAELPVRTAPAENDTARGMDAYFTIGPGRYYKRLP